MSDDEAITDVDGEEEETQAEEGDEGEEEVSS